MLDNPTPSAANTPTPSAVAATTELAATGAISSSKMRQQCCSQQGVLRASSELWGCGLGCTFLANFVFSFSALFVKLTGGRVPVLEVCLVRSLLCWWLLSIGLMAAANIRPMFGQRRNLKLLCCRGCCGALSLVAYYTSLMLLPLGDCVTIGLIGPPITAVAARIFLKEPLGARGLLGCFVSMAGVLILSHPPFLAGGHEDWGPERALGTLAGLISSLLGAGSTMIIRTIGSSEPAAVIGIWFHTGTIVTTVLPLALGLPDKFRLMSPRDASLIVGMAVTAFGAQLLNTRGLQLVAAAKAAAIGFTGVLYSYILGGVFFHETISVVGLLGVALILAGVLLVTIRPPSDAAVTTGTGRAISCKQQNDYCCCEADDALEVLAPMLSKGSAPSDSLDVHGSTAAASAGTAGAGPGVHGAVFVTARSDTSGAEPAGVPHPAAATPEVALAATDARLSLSGWHNYGVSSLCPPTGGPAAAAVAAAVGSSPFQQQQQQQQGFDLGALPGFDSAMAQIAAEAASASAGELCPAATAAIAASRQASVRAAVLEASRHGSTQLAVDAVAEDAGAAFAAAVKTAALLSRQGSQQQAAGSRAPTAPASRQPSGRWFGSSLLASTAPGSSEGPQQQQQQGHSLKEALLAWDGDEPSSQQPQQQQQPEAARSPRPSPDSDDAAGHGR